MLQFIRWGLEVLNGFTFAEQEESLHASAQVKTST